MTPPTIADAARAELLMLREQVAKLKAYARAERRHLLCLQGKLPPRTYDSFKLRDEVDRLRAEILPIIEYPAHDPDPPGPDPRPVPGPRPAAQAAPDARPSGRAGAAEPAGYLADCRHPRGCGYPACCGSDHSVRPVEYYCDAEQDYGP